MQTRTYLNAFFVVVIILLCCFRMFMQMIMRAMCYHHRAHTQSSDMVFYWCSPGYKSVVTDKWKTHNIKLIRPGLCSENYKFKNSCGTEIDCLLCNSWYGNVFLKLVNRSLVRHFVERIWIQYWNLSVDIYSQITVENGSFVS